MQLEARDLKALRSFTPGIWDAQSVHDDLMTLAERTKAISFDGHRWDWTGSGLIAVERANAKDASDQQELYIRVSNTALDVLATCKPHVIERLTKTSHCKASRADWRRIAVELDTYAEIGAAQRSAQRAVYTINKSIES
jgi:hypothetical protein